MDKVRAFLSVVWKQRFWVLCVVGVIIATVCWKMSASALDAEFTANKQQIDGKFGELDAITGKSVHGNDEVNNKEREQAVIIRGEVLELWNTMYERQKENVLKWPAELQDDFLEAVEGKKFRESIGAEQRQRYRTYAKEVFPKLVEMVQAKKMATNDMSFGGGGRDGGRGGGDFGGGMGNFTMDEAMPEMDPETGEIITPEKYLVQWIDQGAVQQKLNFTSLPSVTAVWVTQEDLWVYETLLTTVNETNLARDSTRPDNAAIRAIMALNVGQDASAGAKEKGNIMMPPGAGGSDPSAMGDLSGRGGGADALALGAASGDAGLLMNRYIGPDGLPIADASVDPGGECRRLPVRMQLIMDAQAIPTLLAECANASLPVEVQRVRINVAQSGAGFDTTIAVVDPAAAAMPSDGRGGGMVTDGGRGGGFDGGRGGGSMSGGANNLPQGSGLVTVDLFGIVYIYNPPDPAALTVPGADAAELAAVPAETPTM
jgi:hypothetical protein